MEQGITHQPADDLYDQPSESLRTDEDRLLLIARLVRSIGTVANLAFKRGNIAQQPDLLPPEVNEAAIQIYSKRVEAIQNNQDLSSNDREYWGSELALYSKSLNGLATSKADKKHRNNHPKILGNKSNQ